jgi:hypothetical protein
MHVTAKINNFIVADPERNIFGMALFPPLAIWHLGGKGWIWQLKDQNNGLLVMVGAK